MYLYNSIKNNIGSDTLTVELDNYKKKNVPNSINRLLYLFHINSYKYYKKSGCCDVVHYTNYAMPLRRNKTTKYVVTIHDLASFIHPETVPALYAIYNRTVIKYAVKKADLILTVSQSVKSEILKKWPSLENKIKVIYPGVYSEFFSNDHIESYDSIKLNHLQERRFFLFTGTIETRKNLGIIIDAFHILKCKGLTEGIQVVFAGRDGHDSDLYKKKIDSLGLTDSFIFTGYLSSNDISKLYQDALAYIFPSIYEGFGSTQLECMINHTPIILSSIPTNKEISGEYGVFFNLNDTQSLASAMEIFINNSFDIKKNRVIADRTVNNFRWDKLSEIYIEAYRELSKK